MKSELKDINKGLRERIKELDAGMIKLKGANDELVRQGQQLQQKLAQNNTEIIKLEGGKAELEKMIRK